MSKKDNLFVRWAKSKRVYSAWRRNIDITEKEALRLPGGAISTSFVWADSPEGKEYWRKLNKEWIIRYLAGTD